MSPADLRLCRPGLGPVAEALDELLRSSAATAIGDGLGVAGTTVSRRGSDLHAWPASELLHLAAASRPLRAAVAAAIAGEAPRLGEAVRALGDAHAAIGECGRLISATAQAVADGRIDRDEAQQLRTQATAAMASLDQLLADLRQGAR